jgi:proline iminopeptidase
MIPLDGAQLFSLDLGQGPPIVLLHGGPGASHDYLRPQLDQLGGRRVYYDQRGGGKSRGAGPGSWRDHVSDLEAVRRHLGVEKLRLCGYSWGALLGMLYAVEHPDRVERLALVSPAPAAARERAAMNRRLEEAGRRPEVEALRTRLDATDRRHRFALAVAGYFHDPARALELSPFLVQQRAADAVWESLGDYDLRPALQKLEIPSLVAHGRQDPIPIETARATAAALSAELHEYDGCGHVPYIEAASALFPALRRFFQTDSG